MLFNINANANTFSGIVFWEYDKNDSYDNMIEKKYCELLKAKPNSFFLSFNTCLKYDNRFLEFVYADEVILNPEISLSDWQIGNCFFSVIVDNEIVLTGLNRVGYFGASRLLEDEVDRIYLCWIEDEIKRFKLTTDYVGAFNMFLDQDYDLIKIDTNKIDNYFSRKK